MSCWLVWEVVYEGFGVDSGWILSEKKKEKMMGFWVAGFRGGGSLNFFDW